MKSLWMLLCFFVFLPLHCFFLLCFYCVKGWGRKSVYISGAISGVPDYREKFEARQKEIEESCGYFVVNPAKNIAPPFLSERAEWLYYICLSVVGLWYTKEMVYVGRDYADSVGVRVELLIMQRIKGRI